MTEFLSRQWLCDSFFKNGPRTFITKKRSNGGCITLVIHIHYQLSTVINPEALLQLLKPEIHSYIVGSHRLYYHGSY